MSINSSEDLNCKAALVVATAYSSCVSGYVEMQTTSGLVALRPAAKLLKNAGGPGSSAARAAALGPRLTRPTISNASDMAVSAHVEKFKGISALLHQPGGGV